MHLELLRLRRTDATITAPIKVDGAVLGESAFVLRLFGAKDDRLLIVNLGSDLWLEPAPEPLLAPHENRGWRCLWSSESPVYGGSGAATLETNANWIIPGESAALLCPDENAELTAARLSQEN